MGVVLVLICLAGCRADRPAPSVDHRGSPARTQRIDRVPLTRDGRWRAYRTQDPRTPLIAIALDGPRSARIAVPDRPRGYSVYAARLSCAVGGYRLLEGRRSATDDGAVDAPADMHASWQIGGAIQEACARTAGPVVPFVSMAPVLLNDRRAAGVGRTR